MYHMDVTSEIPFEQLSDTRRVETLSHLFHGLSNCGTELVLAMTALDMDIERSVDGYENTIQTANIYTSIECLPGYKQLISRGPEHTERRIEEYVHTALRLCRHLVAFRAFKRFGSCVFNAPDASGMTILQQAFVKSHAEVVDFIISLAKRHNFRLAMASYPRDMPPGNLLQNALERKSTNDVKEAFLMLTSNVVPFGSAAHIMKHSFKDLLAEHRHLVEHALSNNLLSREVCQLKVHVDFLTSQSAQDASQHIQTSDTVLEWTQNSDAEILADTWRQQNKSVIAGMEKSGDISKSAAKLRFLCIQDASRFGMQGILRHLLMHDVPEYFFTYPAVAALIQFKWHNLWRGEIMKDFFYYLLNMALLVTYMLLFVSNDEDGYKGNGYDAWSATSISEHLLLSIMFVIGLFKLFDEVYQFYSFIQDGLHTFGSWKWGIRYYFKSMWNSLDFALCVLILGPIPLFHILRASCPEISGFRTVLSVTLALQAILTSIKVCPSHFSTPLRECVIASSVF